MAEVKDKADGFFVDNGLLVRKWVACGEFSVGSPIFQIVVPAKFCIFLQLSHVQSGHMGVRRTYDPIWYFFWPPLNKDASKYIRTCYTSQITGKPNKVIKPAQLHPIPAGIPRFVVVARCQLFLPYCMFGQLLK